LDALTAIQSAMHASDRDMNGSRALPPLAVDSLIVAVLIGAGLLQQFGQANQPPHSNAHQLAHAAVIVGAVLPLLLRRRFPFLTVVIITAVIGVTGSIGPLLSLDPSPSSAFGLLFATFNAAAARGRFLGWAALVLSWVAVTLLLRPWVTPVGAWLPNYPGFVVAVMAGLIQSQRIELSRVLETRLVDVQAQRARRHRLALQRARNDLARDLHDVVTHALKQMHARAAEAMRQLVAHESAERALVATEAAGRSALVELRRLLKVLRSDHGGHRSPPPGQAEPTPALHPAPHLGPWPSAVRVRAVIRRLARRTWLVDVALVSVVSLITVVEIDYWRNLLGASVPPSTFSRAAYVWAVAWVLLLLFRRPAPVLTALAMAVMAFLQTYPFRYWTPVSDIVALQIAVYTVGSRYPRRPHVWVLAAFGGVGQVSIPPPPVSLSLVGFLVITTVTLWGAAYVGTVVGERRRLNAELEENLEALAEERRTELALALNSERVALARDMHDLVAHSLSLMVVQAGAARMVAATDQQAARQAVGVVLDTGQQATGELDELLSLLRGDTTMPASSSPPNVEELVGQARLAGLDVDLQRVGTEPVAAGSTLEVFEYRLVQEALTNVRKHAPDARVHVRLQHDPDSVVIHVENTPPAATPGALVTLGAGHGLLGMRERVALLGGQLQAEPTQTGGFAVRAVMPRELVET